MHELLIFGAGAHARRVANLATLCGWKIACFIDEAAGTWRTLLGVEVLGSPPAGRSIKEAVVAIGNSRARIRIQEMLEKQGTSCPVLIHPAASVSRYASLGPGTVVMAGAVIEAPASIGRGVIIDIGALIDHDVQIGDFSHIRPGAVVNSYSKVAAFSIIVRN